MNSKDIPSPNEESVFEALRANLQRVHQDIARAADRSGRDPASVTLLAVTKYVDIERVRLLCRAGAEYGAVDIGENTVQNLRAKSQALADVEGIRWHLIGHLQRNKVAHALRIVSSIQSVDSERLLREVGAQARRLELPVPDLYVEVNVAHEDRKTGLPPEGLRDLLRLAQDEEVLPGGQVRGLMAMAPWSDEPEDSRPHFRHLREMRDALLEEGLLPPAAGLSMGMSGDFQVAVEEGATVIRVGTVLFEGLA